MGRVLSDPFIPVVKAHRYWFSVWHFANYVLIRHILTLFLKRNLANGDGLSLSRRPGFRCVGLSRVALLQTFLGLVTAHSSLVLLLTLRWFRHPYRRLLLGCLRLEEDILPLFDLSKIGVAQQTVLAAEHLCGRIIDWVR